MKLEKHDPDIRSKGNEAIISSFYGQIEQAVLQTHYKWCMIIALMTVVSFCIGISVISSVIGEWLSYRNQGTTSWLNNVKGAGLLTAGLNLQLIGFLFFMVLLWLSLL